jgi:hypothetical protein
MLSSPARWARSRAPLEAERRLTSLLDNRHLQRKALACERAGPPKDPGRCHDATPWTQFNRVPLCQATLSIGPYLLLKVQFHRHPVSRTFSNPNPRR